jgi:serine/threonine protein phosphatase 1
MREFAISDIHGCNKTFEALLDQIAFSKADILYLLGDYVDRGPDSKGVIDRIWALQGAGYRIACLKGNHEELVLRAASGNFTYLEKWLKTDGKDTIDSFGVQSCAEIPQRYLDWMDALPYFLEINHYLLVHAGLDFSLEDPLSDTSEMCWLRRWQPGIRYEWLRNRIIVHGHTPITREGIEMQHKNLQALQYLDIDAGCVYGDPRLWREEGLGNLCAFDMTNQQLIFKELID